MILIRLRLLVVMLLMSLSTQMLAKHIFGGYIGIYQVNKSSANFRVTLTFYTDLEEMDSDDLDRSATGPFYINIYSKRTNALLQTVKLGNAETRDLVYDNQACAQSLRLRTREYTFSTPFTLKPDDYADPQGYYMAWDHCCRNAAISNLNDPRNANILLVTEFPALAVNGQFIAYSSPQFGTLNGDYICLNKQFTYNFSATDSDGDELRYSLVSPHLGKSNSIFSNIPAGPGPYPDKAWASGYSANNAIPGTTPLKINASTGLLTLRANQAGIYMFVVQVDEYRNGQKIGSVRQEFQFPVIDCSNQSVAAPVITQSGQPVEQVSICTGEIIELETPDDPAWAFQWQEANENLPNEIKNKLRVDKPGEYTVVKSLAKQCAADASSKTVVVTLRTSTTQLKINAPSTDLCAGRVIELNAPTSISITYEWYSSGTKIGEGFTFTATSGGEYELKGKVGQSSCGITGDKVIILDRSNPTLPFGEEVLLCPGSTAEVKTLDNPNWRYEWSDNGKVLGKTATLKIERPGNYIVDVWNEYNCHTRSAIQKVFAKTDCIPDRPFIPNAFSPNQDGVNDQWIIRNLTQWTDCQVYVYDRWGGIIFHSVGYTIPWDGTHNGQPLASNIYTYRIIIPALSHTYTGSLYLLR